MSYGVRTRSPSGEVLFDSTTDRVLLFVDEHYITGSGFTTTTYTYPALTGMKLAAFMTSPYQNGDIDGYQVLSCRITYPSGVPTVTVFVDRTGSGIPVCDGMLTVFSTGALQ